MQSSQLGKVWRVLPWLIFVFLSWAYLQGPSRGWGDTANEFAAAWRIADGELPYRDIETTYGPLAYLVTGFFFKLFSPSLCLYRFFTVAFAAGSLFLIQTIALSLAGPGVALLACLSFLSFCAFDMITAIPYVDAYSLSGLHSVFWLLLLIQSIIRFQKYPGTFWAFWAGLSVGYLTGCKVEIAFAAWLVFTLWAAGELIYNGGPKRWKLAAWALAPAILIPSAVYGFLILKAGPALFAERIHELGLYASNIGMRFASPKYYAFLLVLFLFFRYWGVLMEKKNRLGILLPLCAAALCWKFSSYDLLHMLKTLVVIFTLLWTANEIFVNKCKDRLWVYLGILASILHLRFMIGHVASATYTLHVPYVLSVILGSRWVLSYVPAWRHWYASAWVILTLFATGANLQYLSSIPLLVWQTPWGRLSVEDSAPNRALWDASQFLAKNTGPSEKVFAAPMPGPYLLAARKGMLYEDTIWYWFFKSRSMDGARLVEAKQERYIEEMEKSGLRWVVVDTYGNNLDFVFGRDYGVRTMEWIKANFDKAAEFPLESGRSVSVFRRKLSR